MLIRMGAGYQGNRLPGERVGIYPHPLISGEGSGAGD